MSFRHLAKLKWVQEHINEALKYLITTYRLSGMTEDLFLLHVSYTVQQKLHIKVPIETQPVRMHGRVLLA
jgi:hypothetical protein